MLDTNDTALEHAPGVLMVGLSSSQPQCHRKHIISNLLHSISMPHSKSYTFTNGKSIGLQRWAPYNILYSLSAVTVHMWERGGGMYLVTVKYKSAVYTTIYASHELTGLIIPASTSHNTMYGPLND